MKPETEAYVAKAERELARAKALLADGYHPEAARDAYGAILAAIRALIFERSGRTTKTHAGARATFAALTKSLPEFDDRLRSLPGSAFEAKQVVDYADERVIDGLIAQKFVDDATRFVGVVKAVIGSDLA